MSQSQLTAAIVGAAGYVGAELGALLSHHPNVGRVAYVSRSLAGQGAASVIPALRGRDDSVFSAPSEDVYAGCDVVFFATPHAVAMHEAEARIDADAVVIDLSPDFRLRDAAVFEKWYGAHASAHLLPAAVYGLTEAARGELSGGAMLIACPGCFATAVELALIPLAAAGVLSADFPVVADAKSGVSGAGKRADRADLLYAEQAENFKAYATGGHRHQPEIEQAVSMFGGGGMSELVFVPHLLPASRGIYATLYAKVSPGADCLDIMREHWRGDMFIEVSDEVPELSRVLRTNRAQLHAREVGGGMVLLIAALDNLQKGAAGQAVQNMNVRFGLPEDAGLSGAGLV